VGGERLKIDVSEPPEDGKANQAVCAMLARALHRPKSSVRVIAGAASSEKLLAVTGDSAALVDLLQTL
jgi:uncharacterized protein YggU (UPF0235/DUF167 family)